MDNTQLLHIKACQHIQKEQTEIKNSLFNNEYE